MRKVQAKPLVFAVMAALSPLVAQAAVTANQLPGDGTVLYGSASATVSGSSMTVNVTGADNGITIITWGNSGGTLNPNAATGGFNIGSQASVTFTNGTGGNAPFTLNVDTTANPTEIAGSLTGNDVNIGVANGNGILVDGSAVINAPDGLALLNQAYTSGGLAAQINFKNLMFDFNGATGGVTIATGASLGLGGYVFIAGNGNVNIDVPLTVDEGAAESSGGSFNVLQIYGASGSAININAPVTADTPTSAPANASVIYIGNDGGTTNLNIASTGSLTADEVYIGSSIDPNGGSTIYAPASLSVMNILDNGSIVALDTVLGYSNEVPNGSGGYTNITMPGSTGLPSGTVVQAIGSVSGSGYVQSNLIEFSNQVGPVNNDTTGQILANGFQIKAGNGNVVTVDLVPGWSSASGFNIAIQGNGFIGLDYQFPFFTGNGSVSIAPQAASRLIVQATGYLGAYSTVTPSGASSSTPAFVFPGLVYLLGAQGLSVTSPIDTAYSTSTPQGYGVFLLGPEVYDNYPILANGDRGVNIENVNYGPTTINGTNVTQGAPSLPPIYFLESSNGALNLSQTQTFSNEWDWMQPEQVFFVSPQFTGNSYPKS